MKITINSPSGIVKRVSVFQYNPFTLLVEVDTTDKYPNVSYGSGYDADIGKYQSIDFFYEKSNTLDEVRLYPQNDFEKDCLDGFCSEIDTRYGPSVFYTKITKSPEIIAWRLGD